MKLHIYSYRYAQEILQHPNNLSAWNEIEKILRDAPLFIYPGKSKTNAKLRVVQQLMNTYFDRRFAVDCGWQFHPLATQIEKSGLAADYRKDFERIKIQAEVQFGNMARWYSDIFKFQTAYSKSLIHCGLSVVPTASMAREIDSNIAYYERAYKELPSAELSITLPILLVGLEHDRHTPVVDVSACRFESVRQITGRGNALNRWRIVNAYLKKSRMNSIGPDSDPGPIPTGNLEAEDADSTD
jgi:hypothetical protein